MTAADKKPYTEALEILAQAVDACEREPTYSRAIDLCAADREAWVAYYDTWLADAEVQPEAKEMAQLFGSALAALHKVSADDVEHLEAMKKNTAARQRMLVAIGESVGRKSTIERIRQEYKALKVQRGLEVA